MILVLLLLLIVKKETIDKCIGYISLPTPSKRSRQQQIFLGMKFLITVGDNKEDVALKEKYSKLIESHGGELFDQFID